MLSISVILPIYNVEKYLKQCLDSIINQTLKNIEIICINDGSTDGCLEILKYYKNYDDRIIIIDQKNQGSGIARNNGLKIAKGEFIAFVDPDDYYYSNDVLKKLYVFIKFNNLNIVGGNIEIIKENIECLTTEEQNRLINKEEKTKKSIVDFKQNAIICSDAYCSCYNFWRFIYRNSFLKENNILFPSYIRFQDPLFLAKVLVSENKIGTISDIFYCYRINHKEIKSDFNKFEQALCGIHDCLCIFNINRKKEQYTLIFQEFIERFSYLKNNNFSVNEIKFLQNKFFEMYKNIEKNNLLISIMNLQDKKFLKDLHRSFKQNKLLFKQEFLIRQIKHIRRVQDNLLILEINKDNLPFRLKDFELIKVGFKHDIDKFNNPNEQIKISEYWYNYRNNIKNNSLTNEEIEEISNRHYKNSKHHVEYYKNNKNITYLILCEMASDMAAVCQEYKYDSYTKYLLENRNTKFAILSDFQVKILLYLLNLIKYYYGNIPQ